MANTFHEGILLYEKIGSVESNTAWVEIGSERGEGSTLALAGQAERWGTHLYSVDIDSHAYDRLTHSALTCYVESGSSWVKNTWPTIAKKISLLHLDNFDWIWNNSARPHWIAEQIQTYKQKFGIEMNNQNCQLEHFKQALALTPWLSDNCIIALDDTFVLDGVWTGKCGPAVVYFYTQGFRCVHRTLTGGTVLVRGFEQFKSVDIGQEI
jgi:hypothetical protein